jgi:hypothetical protein
VGISLKGHGSLHSMRIKIGLGHQLLKALTVMLVLVVIIFGCKGKETPQQPVPQAPSGAEKEKAVPEESLETAEKLPGETPPEVSGTPVNTAPRITVLNVYPPNPVAGDTLKIDTKAFDKEGDNVNFTYQWWKNDEELPDTSDTLAITKDFKRGDKITVKLVPDDGVRKGTPMEMFVYIANSPPVILPSAETFKFDGSIYSYQARATDPDGDPLKYSLKASPPGMTINKDNGQVQWKVPPDYKGKANIVVAVTDGQGGEILQSFTVEIMPETEFIM